MHLNTLSCLFVVFTSLFHINECCDTGRIFIGSVNETYPDEIDINGIYLVQNRMIGDHHVYKHESRNYYLYRVSGNTVRSMWLVSSVTGNLTATLQLKTLASSPELAGEYWEIWSISRQEWVEERHMKAACVDHSFMTCTSGRINLHGLSPWNHHQLNLTGYYYLTNETHEMRPVYQNEYRSKFLFYVDGLWMVGPEVGRVAAGLFVLDYAWRPEYIIENWIVFNGQQFLRDTKLKATCAGGHGTIPLSLPQTGPEDDDVDVHDILHIAEGMLEDDEGEPSIQCGSSHCHHGGTCIRNEVGDHLCACPEPYFGARCDRVVDCGAAPEIANGRVVSQSGRGFHALAFYSCSENFILMGGSAVTCQADSEWSSPPTCMDWLDHVSQPVAPPTHRRRNFYGAFTRRRKHHRRTRSVSEESITIEEMKAMF